MGYKKYFLITPMDNKNLKRYAKWIDVLVVNANIAIYSKKFIKDKTYNYNLDLIIDPMTYMLQLHSKELKYKNDEGEYEIKPSLKLVIEEIYKIEFEKITFSKSFITNYLNDSNQFNSFLKNIYKFQKQYLTNDELGAFAPENHLKIISSPYFDVTNKEYLELNKKILLNKNFSFDLFRIVVSRHTKDELLEQLIMYINKSKIKYVEIWVDDDKKNQFAKLTQIWKIIDSNIKILFKYISFREIKAIRKEFNNRKRIEGFITAFGYGESRKIYPVGGGIPVNKIYSLWKRTRIDFTKFLDDISSMGFNLKNEKSRDYYRNHVCWCRVCEEILEKNGVQGILLYGEYNIYERKLKNKLSSKRILASQKAIVLTNFHYIENKLREYDDFYSNEGFQGKWYAKYNEQN